MATLGWAIVLQVCEQPAGDLPSDTCLHRLLVSLLDMSKTEGPTIVWHRTSPGGKYWEWASAARHLVLTITTIRHGYGG